MKYRDPIVIYEEIDPEFAEKQIGQIKKAKEPTTTKILVQLAIAVFLVLAFVMGMTRFLRRLAT